MQESFFFNRLYINRMPGVHKNVLCVLMNVLLLFYELLAAAFTVKEKQNGF